MILADTSAWIELLRRTGSSQGLALEQALLLGDVVLGDLILVEVLQGINSPGQLKQAEAAFAQLDVETLCGPDIAFLAAANYRRLRADGITVRGTIDVIIASWCIENGVELLHRDRDCDLLEGSLPLTVHRG